MIAAAFPTSEVTEVGCWVMDNVPDVTVDVVPVVVVVVVVGDVVVDVLELVVVDEAVFGVTVNQTLSDHNVALPSVILAK